MINVTKPFLPPLAEYVKYLEGIWESGLLTNNGPLVVELEQKLKDFLGVKHLFFVTNGTIALQIAIRAAGLKGEVITTPYSYVATTSSLVWENCTPVFADIESASLTIDPESVTKVITAATTAILATHVYGYPCQVLRLQEIAKEFNLKVIYDAAHAFGVNHLGRSIMHYGDISTVSFHATKLFHTIEGGAVMTDNDELAHKISYMRNFGHNGPENFFGIGINGKSSEFQAAMGLALFDYLPGIIEKRRILCSLYDRMLENVPGISRPMINPDETAYNYAYYPVILRDEDTLLRIKKALEDEGVRGRRYIYPSLNTLNYVTNNLPGSYSEDVSKRVLCLPLFPDLSIMDAERIAGVVNRSL